MPQYSPRDYFPHGQKSGPVRANGRMGGVGLGSSTRRDEPGTSAQARSNAATRGGVRQNGLQRGATGSDGEVQTYKAPAGGTGRVGMRFRPQKARVR